jgi:hypothetical protein
MAKTSLTSVGNSADSRAPLLRGSRATGHAADMLDEEDSYVVDYPEKFPEKLPPWQMRSTAHRAVGQVMWTSFQMLNR